MKKTGPAQKTKRLIHLSNRREMPLRIRFLVLMLASMFLLCAGFLGVLLLSGTMSSCKKQNKIILHSELYHMRQEMDTCFQGWSADCILLSLNITEQIQTLLQEEGVTATELRNNTALQTAVLERGYSDCADTLYRSDCSGVFLILSTDSQADSKPGIYIKTTSDATELGTPVQYRLLNGPSKIASEQDITLDPQWTESVFITDAEYYSEPLSAVDSGETALCTLYYWSLQTEVDETGERSVICSVPLLDADGTVYGVCGIEINETQFRSQFQMQEETFDSSCCILLYGTQNLVLNMDESLTTGNLQPQSDGSMQIEAGWDGCNIYKEKNGTGVYYGCQLPLSLYGNTSSFSDEQWTVAVIVPKELITHMVFGSHIKLLALLLLLIASGTLLTFYMSKRWTAPILEGLDALTSAEREENIRIPEIDEVRKYLAEHQKELHAASGGNVSSALMDAFLENLKNLSPAERAVFDLYVRGYGAQEIAERLSLSINTIKTHNKRIYAKLDVNSREELLLYVKLLREAGKHLQ